MSCDPLLHHAYIIIIILCSIILVKCYTSNLRYHLRREHRDKFDELGVKEAERSEQNEAELDSKQRKPNARQLTLAQVKENKEAWTYEHPQHKKLMNWIAEMMALDSQPFSIVEDAGFLRLLANVCPKYVMPSRKYFSEKFFHHQNKASRRNSLSRRYVSNKFHYRYLVKRSWR